MSVTLGEDNVSDTQLHYLERAKRRLSSRELARLLYSVVTDEDIVSGRESLHPDWVAIFEQHRPRLESAERSLGLERSHTLDQIFGALSPIDPSVYSIDPTEEDIVFLLGAGASKPSPSNIPTVTELLPELLSRARRLDREQVTDLADFCDKRRIRNIEDLLTAVQISAFCSRNPGILSLVEFQLFGEEADDILQRQLSRRRIDADVSSVAYIEETLQVLFGLLSNLMLPASPNKGHQAIVDYLSSNSSTPIITTNYDCCIDLALIENNVEFSYNIDFANSGSSEHTSGTVCPLIKLHGSLNWFYCETCQEVRLIDIRKTVIDYTNDQGEYPISSVCNKCGGQKRGLLVPPHAMKFDIAPPLQPLIASTASYFERSTLIVVVGFSFADADLYISRMLIKAMQGSDRTKMIIVDPDASVIEKVRQKFNAQIPNFDAESRIIKLQDDCAKVLPEFLEGRLFGKSDDDDTEDSLDATQAMTPATVAIEAQ